MAYYLGYKKGNEYIPIELNIDNDSDILSIVNYTTNFYDEIELKESLMDEKKLPSDQVSLFYLIDKGKRFEKEYLPLPNKNEIYYNAQKKYFDINTIRNYILMLRNDQEFFRSLLYSSLKKYGIDQKISVYFHDQSENLEMKMKLLKALISESPFTYFNSIITSLIQSGEKNMEIPEYLLNSFCQEMINNKDILIYVYNKLKTYLKFPRTNETDRLNIIIDLLSVSNPNYERIDTLINSFIETYIKSSNNKINSRNIFDLGVFVLNYKEYKLQIEINKYTSQKQDDFEEYEEEEFLEESDFARCNTTSEESGVRLRRTEYSKWEENQQ